MPDPCVSTTFEYSDAKISQTDDAVTVTVTVKNTGEREGKEVVELYIAAPDAKAANKPAKELKATLSAPVMAQQTKANNVLKPQSPLNLLKR